MIPPPNVTQTPELLDVGFIVHADVAALLQALHMDLSAVARADESFYLHDVARTLRCEHRGSNGVESLGISSPDLPESPAGSGIGACRRILSQSQDGFSRWLHSRGIKSCLSISWRLGQHAWWWVLARRSAEGFTDDETTGATARFQDVAAALALRDALRNSDSTQEQLELILNHSTDAIIVVDAENKIRLFNEAASEIFGYEPREVLGREYDLLLPPEMRNKGEAEHIRQLVEQGAAGQEQESLRWSKDGKPLALKVRWAAVRSPQGTLVSRFSFIRDLRPIKRLREELVRAQSLAMIGELAASVAHEVRNPLASIQAAIESLRAEIQPSSTQDAVIRKILDEIQRLDNTVERLLIFAKPWEVQAREYDLAVVIQGIASAIKREPESQAVVIESSCPSPCPVTGDPQLVEHVLTNVLHNAIQAMPSGGKIDVRANASESTIEILVRDTGPGIPPEHQAKLFRPFFTTKSRGTGLGLATCQKMLHAHKGSIKVSNADGARGAEVLIKLPRVYR